MLLEFCGCWSVEALDGPSTLTCLCRLFEWPDEMSITTELCMMSTTAALCDVAVWGSTDGAFAGGAA